MMKEEDKYFFEIRINKLFLFSLICIFVCGVVFYYFVLLPFDSVYDVHLCEIGMTSLTNTVKNCWANEDYNKFNLGHDIKCTCFYEEPNKYIGTMLIKKEFTIK